MAGVVLGVIGISLITTTGEVSAGGHLLPGVLACLFATACYGLAGFLTRSWITHRGVLDAKLVAFGSQLGASLFLLPFSLTSWRPALRSTGPCPPPGPAYWRSAWSAPPSPICSIFD